MYLQPLKGDAATLPQATFLSRFAWVDGEVPSIGCEDFQSCYSLFKLPHARRDYMAFENKVPCSLFGIPGGGYTYVTLTIVPMGCSLSVDIIRQFLRRCVHLGGLIGPRCELRVRRPFPSAQGATICLDGFDVITREPPKSDRTEEGKLYILETFCRLSKELGLPLNVSKWV